MLPVVPNSKPQPAQPEIKRPLAEIKTSKINLFRRDNYFVEEAMGFHGHSKKRSGLKLTFWSWMSAFIDGLILISISCFTIILFSILMKSQMLEVLKFFMIEPNIVKMFVGAFVFSFWIYLIIMRIFMGASLGEWSCQLRLGQPTQRIKISYIFRVIARTSLILLTGVVTLPILSLICKRDLVGELTGLKVYSLM